MNGDRFAYARPFHAFLERALKSFFVHVMATFNSAVRIDEHAVGRKHPEPCPALAGLRVFVLKRVRKIPLRPFC